MRTRTPLTLIAAGLALAAAAAPAQAQEPPFNSSLVSNFDQSGSVYGDVWGDGNFAYVAHFGQSEVDVVDISNPANPILASNIQLPSSNSSASAQDVRVGDDLLFVALESGGNDGVAIYDVRNPYNPVLRTLVDADPGSFTNIHNVFYLDGWLYMCNSSDNTVAIVDLRTFNPDAAPASISSWDYRLQNVASTFVHDITVVDGYLYCSGWDSMWVYDVSNLGTSAPTFVGSERGINSHAVWASADSTWCVTIEEREGGAIRLYEIDINGSNVDLIPRDSYTPAASSAYSGHNAIVDGDRVYMSCYQKGGLVFDIDSSSKTWELVASYDTSNATPSGFSGDWGVYPFLGVDQVLLSDLSNGLYVVDFSALDFDFVTARPLTYDPIAPPSIDVNIDGLGNKLLNAGSPTLYTRVDNGSFTGTAMTNTGSSWSASLPGATGGARVDYYVQATDLQGGVWRSPIGAPQTFHTAYATAGLTTVFSDDFSTDQGWTESGSAGAGDWVRVNPNASGAQSEDDDPDGSDTFCYVTGNASAGSSDGTADVDGTTTLTSPDMDFSAGDGLLSWTRWFFNDDADTTDEMIISISDDGGSSYTTVKSIEVSAGGWIRETIRVSDYVSPTNQVRLRIVVDDSPNDSVTEGGFDSVVAQVFDDGGGTGTDASVTFRNGSGTNPAVYSTVTLPIIGTNWVRLIDAGSAGATGGLTFALEYQLPLAGLPTAFGELLVDTTSPFIGFTTSIVVAGSSTHSSPIPDDNSLLGFTFSSQAFVNQVGLLTNALDVSIGDQ